MGRTNIVLDEKLVEAAMQITKLKTRRELVDFALHEVIRHAKQKEMLRLKGKITWEGDLNQSRRRRYSS